jgi:hypothetical protein
MPPVWNGGHPDYDTERDFVGYGEAGLNPKWPNNAKIAISFVINYEEVLFLFSHTRLSIKSHPFSSIRISNICLRFKISST